MTEEESMNIEYVGNVKDDKKKSDWQNNIMRGAALIGQGILQYMEELQKKK